MRGLRTRIRKANADLTNTILTEEAFGIGEILRQVWQEVAADVSVSSNREAIEIALDRAFDRLSPRQQDVLPYVRARLDKIRLY